MSDDKTWIVAPKSISECHGFVEERWVLCFHSCYQSRRLAVRVECLDLCLRSCDVVNTRHCCLLTWFNSCESSTTWLSFVVAFKMFLVQDWQPSRRNLVPGNPNNTLQFSFIQRTRVKVHKRTAVAYVLYLFMHVQTCSYTSCVGYHQSQQESYACMKLHNVSISNLLSPLTWSLWAPPLSWWSSLIPFKICIFAASSPPSVNSWFPWRISCARSPKLPRWLNANWIFHAERRIRKPIVFRFGSYMYAERIRVVQFPECCQFKSFAVSVLGKFQRFNTCQSVLLTKSFCVILRIYKRKATWSEKLITWHRIWKLFFRVSNIKNGFSRHSHCSSLPFASAIASVIVKLIRVALLFNSRLSNTLAKPAKLHVEWVKL